MIVHLDIKIKNKCKKCSGTGEIVFDKGENLENIYEKFDDFKALDLTPSEHRFFTYMCSNCDGNGYTWKKRTITSKQLKGILDEKD
tara:strand:+ start:1448 stop:1705 length:258 start_codon:yes stop_codon:yes gene_type:complete